MYSELDAYIKGNNVVNTVSVTLSCPLSKAQTLINHNICSTIRFHFEFSLLIIRWRRQDRKIEIEIMIRRMKLEWNFIIGISNNYINQEHPLIIICLEQNKLNYQTR